MRALILITALAQICAWTTAYGKSQPYSVVVAEPYIELHTGPGRGYPVFHVVDRGAAIEVFKRRTDWFKVRTARGIEGWVGAGELARTLEPGGAPARIRDPGRSDYLARRRELGLGLGDFDGANVISVYGAWLFNRNLSGELSVSQITGDFSDGWMLNANIVHQPFPQWRASPFFTLGTGIIRIDPKASLVSTDDRTDQVGHVGLGLRVHISRRFMVRVEYKSYVVFTSRDDNEEVDEWKAGFSFFF